MPCTFFKRLKFITLFYYAKQKYHKTTCYIYIMYLCIDKTVKKLEITITLVLLQFLDTTLYNFRM